MNKSALVASHISIREMQTADIPAVSDLAVRIWRAHYPDIISTEQIEYMLPGSCSADSIQKKYIKEKHQRFWLIYLEAALAGYIAVEPKEAGAWFIDKLYVDPSHHGAGLGGSLLEHIVNLLKPRTLNLRTNRKNIKAINFYFKHGFFIESLDVLDIGGGFVMDDFIMKKIL